MFTYYSNYKDSAPELIAFFEQLDRNKDTVLHMPGVVTWPVYQWSDLNRFFNTYASTDNFEIIKDQIKIDDVPKDPAVHNWNTRNKIDRKKCRGLLNQPNTGFVITQGIDYHNPFTAGMCANLETLFNGICGAHVYGGVSETFSNGSFPAHADKTVNVILQTEGESHWTVYNESKSYKEEENLTINYSELLKPGDLLYIPKGRYHKCSPKSRRLSISFCCVPDEGQIIRSIEVL